MTQTMARKMNPQVLTKPDSIIVRIATIYDSDLIFKWRNDPVTISTSRSCKPIEWDGHSYWFFQELSNPNTVCLIGCYHQPFGVCWFRINRSSIWETSVNTDPAYRGKGLSVPLLSSCMDYMRENNHAKIFSTEIKDGNEASVKMFERCGFVYIHPSHGFATYCTL